MPGGRRRPPLHVALIGLPGAGKSTIGRRLSKELRWKFVDLDSEIERSAGLRVTEIFCKWGEPRFRELEQEVSQLIGSSTKPRVISTGGGWAENRSAVAHLRYLCRIIYLRVSPAVAFERVQLSKGSRPLLAGPDALQVLEQLLDRRSSCYEELADATIDAVGPSKSVVKSILEQIKA